MAALAFMLPILPGKAEADREAMNRFTTEEKDQWEAAHRALGVTRHAVWHQETPAGGVAIVLLEGDDLQAAMAGFATSEEDVLQALREVVREVHGVDLATDAPPQVELIFDSRF
jgi:hypothetical protein